MASDDIRRATARARRTRPTRDLERDLVYQRRSGTDPGLFGGGFHARFLRQIRRLA